MMRYNSIELDRGAISYYRNLAPSLNLSWVQSVLGFTPDSLSYQVSSTPFDEPCPGDPWYTWAECVHHKEGKWWAWSPEDNDWIKASFPDMIDTVLERKDVSQRLFILIEP